MLIHEAPILGITGPIGSGKSTVASHIQEQFGHTPFVLSGIECVMKRPFKLDGALDGFIEAYLKSRVASS